jgi:hypothetical protein
MNKKIDELLKKMDSLLKEAQENGLCFAFDITLMNDRSYRKGEPLIVWSDDDTFTVSVEEV